MQIGFRVPRDIAIALEKRLAITGEEKTEYMLGLIRKDLGLIDNATLVEKVESHDVRIASIEARLNS